jgi:hypothetical protein
MSTRSSHDSEESDADLKEDENGDQLELEPPGLVTVPLRRVVRTEGRMNPIAGRLTHVALTEKKLSQRHIG